MAPQLFDSKVIFEVAKSAPGGVAGGIYIGGVRWFEFSLRICIKKNILVHKLICKIFHTSKHW